ncbi:NAD(P)/FAD-dependent oxidoreductase [Micromonospora sp. WMMD998]|uniref:NAD(P)/FAD-dependent oxidoreductase n=1 Tax=Micromonospora sp. WMMD998 TaxID=3016092 RepID=UPI00249B5C16|nr:NAD(P)/FAD-dependent oxidoreductase [Micromonospora sp. WMMD998]WFE41646.1 NAD(P)/FAD-dependent oxidoreductase [Micromonospora sp. WMMD998]
MTELREDGYEVVVIGGGAAGLSGALMLARARRSVLVVDGGNPRNAPAEGVHALLALDGVPPAELLARGRDEVHRYGGHLLTGEVEAVRRDGDGFDVTLADGRRVRAGQILVATGLVDELPEVPGLRERWGRDLVHCPYCHGWEVRDRPIGVIGSGPMSVHQTLLFRQWSDDVVLFRHAAPPLTDEQAEQLAARGVPVVEGEVAAVEVVGDRLTGVRLRDGRTVAREVLTVAPRMVARTGFLAALGLRAVPHESGSGEYVPADPAGRTDVPGVWVAGNVTDLSAQVGAAAATGARTAAMINADLVAAETRAAVEARRRGDRPREKALT